MYLEINKKYLLFVQVREKTKEAILLVMPGEILTIFNYKGVFFHVFYERGKAQN